MLILGIESSCDETGAAIIIGKSKSHQVRILSNVVASSLALHSKTGGIIPENAAREQIKFIVPVIEETLKKAKLNLEEIDAIAVTRGPGLIGSLLVGVETAKVLAYIYNKPLIPVNHLIGHIYANFIEQTDYGKQTTAVVRSQKAESRAIEFPAIGLIVSGGHTDLILIKRHGSVAWLGGTRDDAAGEALDKIGRLLGLPYPGGPYIEKASERGDASRFTFPSPLIDSQDFDFSFSGLKTAALREISKTKMDKQAIFDISFSVQKAIIDVIVKKTIRAARKYNAKSILIGGGVAANETLRKTFELEIPFFVPEKRLCTDNAAMIAAAAFFNNKTENWQKIEANPSLYF